MNAMIIYSSYYYCQIIKELTTKNYTQIRSNNAQTQKIQISSRIKQGDSPSSILFNLILGRIIDNLKIVGKGCRIRKEEAKIVYYVAGRVLIGETEKQIK